MRECHNIIHQDKVMLSESAWHDLGIIKGRLFSRQEINEAGITFTAEKHQLEFAGEKINAWGIFNADTGDFIAPCGEDYAIHQPSVIFDTLDELIEQVEGGAYAASGILGNYEKIWGQADLNATMHIGDDEIKRYLTGLTSFDSSTASHFFVTNTRIVCRNTWRNALSQKTDNALRIRHTVKSHRRLHDAVENLKAVKSDFETTGKRLEFLAERYVNPVDIKNILDAVLKTTDKEMTERKAKLRDNILDQIIELYEDNDNNAFPEQRGSVYNMFNAVTNWVDHRRPTRVFDGESEGVKRAISATIGSGNTMKEHAMEVLMEYAGTASHKPFFKTIVPVDGLLDKIIDENH